MARAGGIKDNVTPFEGKSYCRGATWNSDSNPTTAIFNKASCECTNFCDRGESNSIDCPTGSFYRGCEFTSSSGAGSFCYEGIEAE